MNNPVLYVILNKSLKMSSGKAATQAVHAAMMISAKYSEEFLCDYKRTVIILEAKNRDQMDGISDYLSDAGIEYEYYIDEGVNEVDSFSLTSLAVEPIESDDWQKREIFSGLSLYGKKKQFWKK